MVSNTTSPVSSVPTADDVPSKIADILEAYASGVAAIADRAQPTGSSAKSGQAVDAATAAADLPALKQRTMADLWRLEDATEIAFAVARGRLESAILPAISADPHVQRVVELREAKASARLMALLGRAETAAAVDEVVRQVADDAARQGDWATLRVLRAETAPYLSGRGIDPATSEAPGIVERAVIAVRPRAAQALDERHALDREAAHLAAAFLQARCAIDPALGTFKPL